MPLPDQVQPPSMSWLSFFLKCPLSWPFWILLLFLQVQHAFLYHVVMPLPLLLYLPGLHFLPFPSLQWIIHQVNFPNITDFKSQGLCETCLPNLSVISQQQIQGFLSLHPYCTVTALCALMIVFPRELSSLWKIVIKKPPVTQTSLNSKPLCNHLPQWIWFALMTCLNNNKKCSEVTLGKFRVQDLRGIAVSPLAHLLPHKEGSTT